MYKDFERQNKNENRNLSLCKLLSYPPLKYEVKTIIYINISYFWVFSTFCPQPWTKNNLLPFSSSVNNIFSSSHSTLGHSGVNADLDLSKTISDKVKKQHFFVHKLVLHPLSISEKWNFRLLAFTRVAIHVLNYLCLYLLYVMV